MKILVQGFARILFEMGAGDADSFCAAVFHFNIQRAVGDDGQFVLTDLVALGQVGVEIILAGEHRARRHRGLHGQAELGRHAHRFFIQHRQHTGQPQVHRAGLGIGLGAIRRGGTGEDFALGGELRVNLQPDDSFPFHACKHLDSWRAAPAVKKERQS